MFGQIFTVKTLIRAALTALSIANMGVARAESMASPAAVSDAAGTHFAGALR